ncbi:hypothetical protein [Curtobacterium sp. ER1/6]|uniref:hypothetical protein n=1 Tax=Curtobacterium sp. ER1/6 TaxID=1891920 RepID=UPI00084F93D1|nr:hypothetical protein [Curtobacterium sp. ER1/6]OEI68707.1 hypothetical protein Cus16_1813 [Curtobacterium sp. ER1/6]
MRPTTKDGRRRPFRGALGMVAALAIAVSGLTVGALVSEETTTQPASAAVAADFDPGNIISDANFYNGSAMNAAAVQSFLNNVAANCRQQSGGPVCLKDFTQNVSTIGAVSGRCAAIAGGNKSAATIIAQVGAACGVSQKALLVLLQKEQGIVATSAPTNWMYQHATGFACPDTAPCDPAYRGFAQQVYAAALQFKRYQASPSSWAYQAGRNNSILYNPNAACGRKTVYIQNQATAGLYIYTPYTPNQSSLNNLYGSGDACGAYGNRNFWRMYSDWFGSPTGGNTSPIGSVDSMTTGAGSITVSGWAADPDTTAPIAVHLYVDGVGKASVPADDVRGDLANALGANNTAHGFSRTLTGVASGKHDVCVYGINVGAGGNTLLECRQVSVTGNRPTGVLESVVGGEGAITVSGWAVDRDTTAATWYKVQVDGVGVVSATADVQRTDVAAVNAGAGTTVGFSRTISNVAAGTRTVSLWTQDKPGSGWVRVAEKQTTVTAKPTATGAVQGAFESATTGVGTIAVTGWAVDPDTYSPVAYKIHLDGVGVAAGSASTARADIAARFPQWGSDAGLSRTLTGVTPGKHTVRVWYQDLPSGSYKDFGTKTVTVPAPPSTGATGKSGTVTGAFESATVSGNTIAVKGWAIDPDRYDPVKVKIHLDGAGARSGNADVVRTDLVAQTAGRSSEVGVALTLTGVAAGEHTVRVWYQDLPSGSYRDFGTKTVAVAGSAPTPVTATPEPSGTGRTGAVYGSFDTAVGGKGTVRITGWAIDPDTSSPVQVKVHLDGVGARTATADAVRTDVERVHPGWGPDVGLSTQLTGVTPGDHTVRVWYQDLPSGGWKDFGTKTVRVS